MKNTFKILFISLLYCTVTNAQTKTITISEDAYVQGGETASEALGETNPKSLLICNSTTETKWARITFLKFSLPKKMAEGTSIVLNIPVKVYKIDANPELTFNLDVVGVTNDSWSESSITWANKPAQGVVLGSAEVQQSVDNKSAWIKIKLDATEFKKLYNGDKDSEVTLALANNKFNKTSAIISSKEAFAKNAAYLEIN